MELKKEASNSSSDDDLQPLAKRVRVMSDSEHVPVPVTFDISTLSRVTYGSLPGIEKPVSRVIYGKFGCAL